MPKFTRVVTVTIGASGAMARAVQASEEEPGFGVGPASLDMEGRRLRAVVPIEIVRAAGLEPGRLAIEAGAYRETPGAIEFLALADPSAGWQAPPQRGQRDGVCEFIVEAGLPEGGSGLWLRILYAGAEQLRVLLPVAGAANRRLL